MTDLTGTIKTAAVLTAFTAIFLSFVSHTNTVSAASFDVAVTVATPSASIPISKYLWGVNFSAGRLYGSRDKFYEDFNEEKLNNLGVKLVRFPGGCFADYYEWKTKRVHYQSKSRKEPGKTFDLNIQIIGIDDVIDVSRHMGADVFYQVNIETKEVDDRCNEQSRYKGNVEDAAELVRRYKGILQYFELGDSQWFHWTAAEYKDVAIAYAQAMKQVDPSIKIAVVGYPSTEPDGPKKTEWTAMIKELLQTTCGVLPCFDLATDAIYHDVTHNPTFTGMTAYYPLTNYPSLLKQQSQAYLPKQTAFTNWNLFCFSDPINKPPVNAHPSAKSIEHGLYVVESILTMAQSSVPIAIYNDLSKGGACGMFYTKDKLFPAGQAFTLSSVIAGGIPLQVTASSPVITIMPDPGCTDNQCIKGGNSVAQVSTYATWLGDFMYLFVINRNNRDAANVAVSFSGIYPDPTKITQYKKLSASKFTDAEFKEDVNTQVTSDKFAISVNPLNVIRLQIPVRSTPVTPTKAKISASPFPTSGPVTARPSFQIQPSATPVAGPVVERKPGCMPILVLHILIAAAIFVGMYMSQIISVKYRLIGIGASVILGGFVGLVICSLLISLLISAVLSVAVWFLLPLFVNLTGSGGGYQ